MTTFSVPMHRAVSIVFMTLVAAVAGVVVWCFRSGFLWSGICMIAVAGPLTVMYWYMLLVNPARTVIGVSPEGISVEAPPFTKIAVPLEAMARVFETDLKTDESLTVGKLEGAMRFGKYKNGRFTLKDGRAAVIVTNSDQVLGIETADTLYLLGPADFEAFASEVNALV